MFFFIQFGLLEVLKVGNNTSKWFVGFFENIKI